MDKKIALMELLETVDSIRHDEKGRGKHGKQKRGEASEKQQRKEHDENHSEKKHKNKMSLPAQNTLCLLLKEGSLNQRSIAKQVHVTGQAISELMKKLELREWVLRTHGEQNNENIITLTEKGAEKARALEAKREKTAEQLFHNFTEEEIKSLHYLLGKISRNIEYDELIEESPV